jgi:hypothetical protein
VRLYLPARDNAGHKRAVLRNRRFTMSSETIVVLVIVALAIVGLAYLEIHSRRNKQKEEQKSDE